MERMGMDRRVETGEGSGDPRPTAAYHFRTVQEEARASLGSLTVWDRKLHEEKARYAAILLIRVANSDYLSHLGKALTNEAIDQTEALPVVMGTYKAIRDGFYLEKDVKAVEVRRLMGLLTRGRVIPKA